MNIEIRKLTPELVEDYIHFLILHHIPLIKTNIDVIVCVGVTMTIKTKTFLLLRKEEI